MRVKDQVSRWILSALIAAALITGSIIYQDYGVGWDEQVSYATGLVNYNYVFENDTALLSHLNRDYGVAFELPAVILQKAVGIEDIRDIFLLRRVLSHLLFLTACVCMYLLAELLYQKKIVAATAFLLLWLHPHIFAHSFFNSKDVPFLSFLVISLYFLFRAVLQKKALLFCLAGIAMGLLTGTRIMGILYFALGAGWIVFIWVTERKRVNLLPGLFLFIAGWSIALYASWPFLWTDPFGHFRLAFANMSKFRWDLDVLFNGTYINSTKVPWYYTPVWFAITTPFLFVVAGIAGCIIVLWRLVRRVWPPDLYTQAGAFLVISFLLPVVIVAGLQSVIYDSWRHLYFIYGPFVLLGAGSIGSLCGRAGEKIAAIVCALLFLPVVMFHIGAHPFQYVYFSPLVTSGTEEVRYRYEMDYWGVSYKQALEYILSIDDSPTILIGAQNEPCNTNVDFLPPGQRERFKFVALQEAEYFLTNYRWHPHEYADLPVKVEKIKSFAVQGNTFQSVYRIIR